jgi:hypothetical protein
MVAFSWGLKWTVQYSYVGGGEGVRLLAVCVESGVVVNGVVGLVVLISGNMH